MESKNKVVLELFLFVSALSARNLGFLASQNRGNPVSVHFLHQNPKYEKNLPFLIPLHLASSSISSSFVPSSIHTYFLCFTPASQLAKLLIVRGTNQINLWTSIVLKIEVLPNNSASSRKQEHVEAGKRRLEEFRKKKADERVKKATSSGSVPNSDACHWNSFRVIRINRHGYTAVLHSYTACHLDYVIRVVVKR
ncbi:uncharacterized protein LOC131655554 [Vicia villosa]|uniref:uncharacterized protein LOC131611329 n=1 Tax=Vicia villosa TaxID=3911 RepID=UPI00273C14BA|nr:uncharacterized protein LOC131611329 [Vicia villosa]XP_058781383.1 uncharacterized protein LOC131655554 [Vicia villosa]